MKAPAGVWMCGGTVPTLVLGAKLSVVFATPTDVLLKARSDLWLVVFSKIVHSSICITWPGVAVIGANKCNSSEFVVTWTAPVRGTSSIAVNRPEASRRLVMSAIDDFLIFPFEATIAVEARS